MSPEIIITTAPRGTKGHSFDLPDKSGQYPTGLTDPRYPSSVKLILDFIDPANRENSIGMIFTLPNGSESDSVNVNLRAEGVGVADFIMPARYGSLYRVSVKMHEPIRKPGEWQRRGHSFERHWVRRGQARGPQV
jgi:hypothetical protein